jgi:hypothetical protein
VPSVDAAKKQNESFRCAAAAPSSRRRKWQAHDERVGDHEGAVGRTVSSTE